MLIQKKYLSLHKINNMESKQTAVEWLIHQLITENEVTLKGENYKLFELAKEMEKEQIMESYNKGEFNQGCNEDSEQYFNKTFKSK